MQVVLAWALGLVGLAVMGCQQEPEPPLVAFLLANDRSPRWAQVDEPEFRAGLHDDCAECRYLTANAGNDPDAQARQFRRAVQRGADVIVLNPVDEKAAAALVQQSDVPVIAYDRVVAGADYVITFDPRATGRAMVRAVAPQLDGGEVLVLDGPRGDTDADAVSGMVARQLDRADVPVLATLRPNDGRAVTARDWVSDQLARHPASGIGAVLAADDTQAGGVAEALAAAGVPLADWPLIVGQNADLDAARRIITGRQYATVYKPFHAEARQAADVAASLATGGKVTGTEEYGNLPAFVFPVRVVTIDTLTSVLVREGLYTTEELCDAETLPTCVELGIR